MATAVIENLCPAERGSRMRSAVIILAVALVAVVLMTELRVAMVFRALVFLPLFSAALQLVQAYSGVCVFHARKGTRSTGGEVEAMVDSRLRTQVRERGRQVFVTAAMLSAAATALVLAVAAYG